MRKLFFIVVILLSCCTFLFGAEKIAIQRSTNSDIQSLVIEKDFLIIKSKGKIYTFKLSELLKDKTVQAPNPVPKNLQEAFKYNGRWCFFNFIPSKLNRICYLNNKKKSYKVFKKGDLLERVLYKNKYYARDLNKNIYRPNWEIKKDFSPHLIPAKQYFEALNDKIKSLNSKIAPSKKTIKLLEQKMVIALSTLQTEQKYYDAFLKDNYGKHSKEIKEQLQLYYKNLKLHQDNIKQQQEELEKLIKKLNFLEAGLHYHIKLKHKLENIYQKYGLSK